MVLKKYNEKRFLLKIYKFPNENKTFQRVSKQTEIDQNKPSFNVIILNNTVINNTVINNTVINNTVISMTVFE